MKVDCNSIPPSDELPKDTGVVFKATYQGEKGVFMSIGAFPAHQVHWAADLKTGLWREAKRLTAITLLPNAKVVCGD